MAKIIINLFLTIFIIFSFAGCKDTETPFNVSFKDGTLYGSENHTITVVYAEDKRLHEKFTDLFIKTNKEETKLLIGKELEEKFEIVLPEKNVWYSLTNLWKSNVNLVTFARVQTTTYIINSSQNCTLKFKAVGGDYSYNTEEGKPKILNTFDVSKEFVVQI